MDRKLSQDELANFYDLSTEFDGFDPGLAAFGEAVQRADAFLNRENGKRSMSYHGTLISLNDSWEYHDEVGVISGKVYVLEDDIVDITSGTWNGPHRDEHGTFFMVDQAEMISLGIIDAAPYMRDDGREDNSVRLAFGFNPDDSESDIPAFYARPEDIMMAKYEQPTVTAIGTRLHRDFPDAMARLDKKIWKSAYDPNALVKRLQKFIDSMQADLRGKVDLQVNLARYIQDAIEFDHSWPYGVTIAGPAFYQEHPEADTDQITFDTPSLHYVMSAGVCIEEYRNESPTRIGLSLQLMVPSSLTDGESVDGRLIVPLGSIKKIFSTRPIGSVRESVIAARDALRWVSHPGDADISIMDSDAIDAGNIHPRILEYRRLESFEALLNEAKKRTRLVRARRYSTPQDALEASSVVANWLFEEIGKLGLKDADVIRVSGQGVMKSNTTLTTAPGKFHIDVDNEHPIIYPLAAADTVGRYEGILAEVDEFEEEDGTKFWQAAPKMAMAINDISQKLVGASYPLLSVAVKSSAVVRLDESTAFEFPELDAMRRRNAAMANVVLSQGRSDVVRKLQKIDRAFYNEVPGSWTEARTMLTAIRMLASNLIENEDEAGEEAFRQQLVGRRIELDADTWFMNGKSENHHNVGVVTDLYRTGLPDGSTELVANIVLNPAGITEEERESEVASLAVLRTATKLRF